MCGVNMAKIWWRRGIGRCIAIAFACVLLAAPVTAESPWAGPYMAIGLGLSHHRLSLSHAQGVANGMAQRQGGWSQDAGFLALGYARLSGPLRFAAEIELEPGARPMASGGSCRLGALCARTNLIGTLGPVYRLRAQMAHAIAPGVAVSVGLGLSAAEVKGTRALVEVASANDNAAALLRASSPFMVDDLARGGHIVVGINQALSARVTWGLSLLFERVHVTTDSAVAITAATMSGSSRAFVQLDHRGNFRIDSRSLRLALTWRF